ncbi:MAG: DUF1194 domain-containing protein [Parvibaculaceae bacterium]
MRVLAVFFLLVIGAAAARAEDVDLELVLLADASGSIDDGEIAFQRGGYAGAITHPAVLDAVAGGALQKIAVAYVEWGSAGSQDVVVGWTVVDGETSARSFAQALMAAPRKAHGRNAIGNALAAAEALIEGNAIAGTRKVIDFSGDSAYSWGGVPVALARANALARGIVINGLAILCRDCASGRPVSYDLEKAFADTIIGGPGSFVVTAGTRAAFAEAVRRKLLLEIAGDPPRRRAAMIISPAASSPPPPGSTP